MVATAEDLARDLAGKDIHGPRKEYLFSVVDTLFDVASIKGLLNDKRDVPAVNLLINICCTALPAAILLNYRKVNSHVIGLAYFVINYILYLQRFLLTLHFTEHRRLFKQGEPHFEGTSVPLIHTTSPAYNSSNAFRRDAGYRAYRAHQLLSANDFSPQQYMCLQAQHTSLDHLHVIALQTTAGSTMSRLIYCHRCMACHLVPTACITSSCIMWKTTCRAGTCQQQRDTSVTV